ncbi:NTPase KAP (plasmid) [Azospirillum argentinense]|uniref:NTPase KAP n=1 Tax=Azospirillum argentinense TaxID=2970906 RepID=A0A4D8PRI3_9PROT|nr:P-loop NTPase fold protein [Azospirillum argentinense]QCO00533.1 NTPase KAP [Azospirillum argentinense]
MWADVDTKQDFLNFSEVADLVVEVVGSPAMRPVSVGVFGTWGTGKSTLLNLIEGGLSTEERKGKFIVVRFDAWLYQGFDDSRAALMEVIATTLLEAAKGNNDLFEKAKSLLGRVNKMRALGLAAEVSALAMGVPTMGWLSKGFAAVGDFFSGDGDGEDFEAVREAGNKAKERGKGLLDPEKQRTPPKEIAAFRSEFEEVLRGLGKTLVVFVDNLDRCLPSQTIHTLEALRLFLFMDHTAFVVAADEDMVRHSVSKHFNDPGDRHVTDYLDKLIQVPVRVPSLGVQEVRAYLFLLFASAARNVPADKVESLRAKLEDNLRKAWKEGPISAEDALAVLGPNPPSDVSLGFSIADRMAPMLGSQEQVQGNPRIVKRMLNVVRMRSQVAKRREMPVDEAFIAKLALFERCTDSAATAHLYQEINAAEDGKPKVLANLSKLLDKDSKVFEDACPKEWKPRAAFIREWLSLEPQLAGVNLRPLVYLSRETVPLRSLRGGLSAAAVEGLRVLLRTTKVSSKSANTAANSIPEAERVAAMRVMLEAFGPHGDWTKPPEGFQGALILAEQSAEAAGDLAAFIRRTNPQALPPWLSMLVKNKQWFKAGEAR